MNDPGGASGIPVEQVKRCRSCGFENPGEGVERCRNCWMLLEGLPPVFRDATPKSWWMRLLTPGMIAKWLPLALVLAGVIWWMSAYCQWGPQSPRRLDGHAGPFRAGAMVTGPRRLPQHGFYG